MSYAFGGTATFMETIENGRSDKTILHTRISLCLIYILLLSCNENARIGTESNTNSI